MKKRFKVTTRVNPAAPIACNVLQQDFTAQHPNQRWVADDNAAMESFFHTLKTEHIYFEHYVTREQAEQSIFEYVEVFYNRQRLHPTVGYLSPVAFERQWYQQQGVSLPSVH